LFHSEKVLDHTVLQLCVPRDERNHVIEMADETVGFHMGIRKTTERIRLSFWWINIRKSVEDWIQSCEKCQLKKGWKSLIVYR